MSVQFTYDSLVTLLLEYEEDGSSDFTDAIPQIVALAETRVQRDLDLEYTDSEVATTLDAATGTAPLATDVLSVRECLVPGGPPLTRRALSFVRLVRDQSRPGTPEYFVEKDDATLWVGPIPRTGSDDVTLTLRYVARLTPISPTQSTSWVAAHYGDLLFAATLTEAARYNQDTEREAARAAEYQVALMATRAELKQVTRNDYEPVGAQPERQPKPQHRQGQD